MTTLPVTMALGASNLVPPSLPGPSIVQTFVFERPELFLILQMIAGAVLLWRINNHGALKQLWWMPVACVALGGAVYIYGNAVETTRERLLRLTVEYVDALATGDLATVDAMTADQLVIERIMLSTDKDDLLRLLDRPEIRGITSHSVNLRGGVRDNENAGRTQASVSATHETFGRTSAPGIFEFGWRRTPEGEWKVSRLVMQRQPL